MKLPFGLLAAALAATTFAALPARADTRDERDDLRPLTIAVFGDWPYNQNLLDNARLLIDSVNADPAVSLVMHVGDIHSGSQPCTSAGILPTLPNANPGWNQAVFNRFQQFRAPVVYTPGDNEWTDCHKSKQGAAGDPLKELASVRELFFSRPGRSLGSTDKRLTSQAQTFDPAYPADAQYVENVMWEASRVVFVTLNMPGSNNDTVPWSGSFANPAAQAQERSQRTDADLRWLQTAFAKAKADHARAVVIGLQADMWDPSALAAGGDGLYNYTAFVQKLAELAIAFQRPVLLLNGDSHLFQADQPLADPNSAIGRIHNTPPVPNLTRITVQGSTNAPAEWLRLVIDPRNGNPFSWTNVPYCAAPAGTC